MAPAPTARTKRGAGPYSPKVMAAASTVATQPAPISMSVWRPLLGQATICRSLTPRRISALAAAMATPE